MAKTKRSSGERISKVSKAGKRNGGYTVPPLPNLEKRAARELGEQQFIAKEQLYEEREVKVYNNSWKPRIKKIQVPIDFVFDPTRGREVMSPKFSEKE